MTLPILELLAQIRDRDPNAWPELVRLYRPLILRWLQSRHVCEADAEDISQEVLIQVLRLIDGFEHNGRVGAFRNWLRAITLNVMQNHVRKSHLQETRLGERLRFTVEALGSDSSEVTRQFNREHDRMIVERLLEELKDDVSLQTLTIFRRYCLLEESAQSVAADLAISVNQVYVTRVRVLEKLRAKSELLDDISWSLM